MSRVRTTRLGLTAAVLTAAAVTGTLLIAPAAVAAPPAAPVTALPASAQDVAPFPKEGEIVSAGKTGFLYRTGVAEAPFSWMGYDGTVTPLTGGRYFGSAGSDMLLQEGADDTFTLRDMGSDAEPIVIKSSGTYQALLGVSGTTLVMHDEKGPFLLDKVGDDLVRRNVTGLPVGAKSFRVPVNGEVFTSTSSDGRYLYLIDVATAKVTATATSDNSVLGFDAIAGSKTHLAWYDWTPADDGGHFHLLDVATGRSRIVESGHAGSNPVLSAEWLALLNAESPLGTGRPLVLHSLADGHELRILDRADDVRATGDGTFLVRGVLAREEGVYRVTVGADGKPAAELVASIGRLADFTVTRDGMPKTVTFEKPYDMATLSWEFNHPVSARLTLVHTATRREYDLGNGYASSSAISFYLRNKDLYGMGLYSGEYTWKMTATESFNIGPSIERTGTLTVNRPAAARDHDENGSADLLVRDGAGTLSAYDTDQLDYVYPGWNKPLEPTVLGTGWNTYTLMASPSERTIVGRDRDGVLWIHKGEKQKLLPRTKVGGGWQVYNQITGGSDLNGDGRGDLLARDTSGVLWFYASTGDTKAPFKPRKQIGGGWQTYNLLVAPGNITGAVGGDLLARDTNGVLWLYLGKGDGTFTARRQIGGGWQQFTHLAPFGDKNGDGRVDLYALGATEGRFYTTSGSVTAPFRAPTALYHQRAVLGSGTVF
ncbi:FG-GAP repeat domain-containing protein [Streptomyces hydrogenans]